MTWLKSEIFLLLLAVAGASYWNSCIKSGEDCTYSETCCNSNEICSHVDGHVRAICIRKAHLGSNCQKNLDCDNLKNAKCSENGTCVCQRNYVAILTPSDRCEKKQIENPGNYDVYKDYACKGKVCEISDDSGLDFRRHKESDLMYGEKCSSHSDCVNFLPSTTCIDGECQCTPGTLFSYESLSCENAFNSGLGRKCNEWNSCDITNAYCDNYKVCRCKKFHYFKNGSCIFDWNYECPENHYFNIDTNKCTRYVQDEGRYCVNQEACSQIKGSKCRGTCKCGSNASIRNKTCIIRLREYCFQSDECNVENSKCVNGHCQCIEDTYPSNDRFQCLPLAKKLHDSCENVKGCSNIKNSDCNGTCVCLNAREVNGTCLPLVHGHCDESLTCQTVNSECRNGWCQCLEDHYPSKDQLVCYKYAKEFGESCADDKGCIRLKGNNVGCLDRECKCKPNYTLFDGECLGINGARCAYYKRCVEDFKCLDNICKCPEYAKMSDDGKTCDENPKGITCSLESEYFYPPEQACVKWAKVIGDRCTPKDRCQGLQINNVNCIDSICQCWNGYIINNGTCQKLIDTSCFKNDYNCYLGQSQCRNWVCSCADGH